MGFLIRPHTREVVMVTGMRDGHPRSEVRDAAIKQCKQFCSQVFDIGDRTAGNHIRVIVNESSLFWLNKENVQEVQSVVWNRPLCRCGGITTILFCHCHVSKVVYNALKTKEFLKYR